jgi:hypothetical protein
MPKTKPDHPVTYPGASAMQPARDSRHLVERLLDMPQLARVVPQLPSEVLHRVVQSAGLDQCGELLGLATPAQLAGVLDLDLWRAAQPGRDEQFDADRFAEWLEVLVESGAAGAADIVARMDAGLVTAALAQHARVFDPAAPSPVVDGEVLTPDEPAGYDLGGYLVAPARSESWDAIVAVLTALEEIHPDYFHRVMRGCRRLSHSAPEIDGLDNLLDTRDQAAFDLAYARERRREQQGYVSPAQARAFLESARTTGRSGEAAPPGGAVARAYFRAIDSTGAMEPRERGASSQSDSAETATSDALREAAAAVVEVLRESGIVPEPPRALLGAAREETPRLAQIRRCMEFVSGAHPAAWLERNQELAFLANTVVAGCSIQGRSFELQEATDAAIAACNLGLENWPRPVPDDLLIGQDLVSVFQLGWSVLYEEVCLYSAKQLITILRSVRCGDRETQAGLNALRVEMTKHCRAGVPWRGREALDVIAILDMPAWATLLGLVDECPVLPAAAGASRDPRTRAVSASAFEFISEKRQIAAVRDFLRELPRVLSD